MSLQGVGSHGAIISFQPGATPGVWTEIAELGDISGPGFFRNDFDITSHNRDIDAWIIGVQRREPFTFPVFLNKAITSQQLLRTAQFDGNPTTNMANGMKIETADGDVFIMSGGIKDFKETLPVDGVRTANVTFRATGEFSLNGVVYGS